MFIQAAHRLIAVLADEEKTKEFLTEIGFKGLVFKASGEDIIKFRYTTYDQKTLDKYLGEPKPAEKSIRYNYGKLGVIAIWPQNKTVVLKNSRRKGQELPRVTPTETHVPVTETPPIVSPNTPGSTDNDDAKVPVTHISPELEKEYKYVQHTDNKEARLRFIGKLWHYLNTNKFQGKMVVPKFRLLKNVGASSMRLRGRWWAAGRLLELAPRLFNASQNFFVEILCHEMCHQAVSEIDMTRDTANKGHGPIWAKWMKHTGLNPLRFDPNDNTTYMNKDELVQHQKKVDQNTKLRSIRDELVEKYKLRLATPYENMPATIIQEGVIYNGMLVCQHSSSRGVKIWAFLDEITVASMHGAQVGTSLSWKNTYATQVYTYVGPNRLSMMTDPIWKELGNIIRNHYENKKAVTTMRRSYNFG